MNDATSFFSAPHLFQLETVSLSCLFDQTEPVWAVLHKKRAFLDTLSNQYPEKRFPHVTFNNPRTIWIEEGVSIADNVVIEGPCYIGKGCEIRPHAFIRSETLLLEEVIIGHAVEIVRSVVLKEAKIPHLSYVGDSIIGQRCNIGAGVKLANQRLNKEVIEINHRGQRFSTRRTKLGAILGDGVSIGCNAVLNPGTIVFPGVAILPLSLVKGVVRPQKSSVEETT